MYVEDYILSGICEGCDQDPTRCFNEGKCFYDAMREVREEKEERFDDQSFRRIKTSLYKRS